MSWLLGMSRPGAGTLALGATAAFALAACSAPTQPAAGEIALQQLRADAQAVAGAEASGNLAAARNRLARLRAALHTAQGTLSADQVSRIENAIALVAGDLAAHRQPSTARPSTPAPSPTNRARNMDQARAGHADLRRQTVTMPAPQPTQPSPVRPERHRAEWPSSPAHGPGHGGHGPGHGGHGPGHDGHGHGYGDHGNGNGGQGDGGGD